MKFISVVLILLGAGSALADHSKAPARPSRLNHQILFLFTSQLEKYWGTRTQAMEFYGCSGSLNICAHAYTIGITHTPVPACSIFQGDDEFEPLFKADHNQIPIRIKPKSPMVVH